MLLSNYGQIIRAKRKKKGFTVGELADLAGMTHPQVSRIENRKSSLTLNSALRITYSLNIPLSVLLPHKIISALPLYFQNSILTRDSLEKYPTLNYKDLVPLDSFDLFRSGEAEIVIKVLLKQFIESILYGANTEKVKSITQLLYNYLAEKKSPASISVNLPPLLPEIAEFRYPQKLSLDNIRNIYLAGGVLIFLDIGAYIRQIRFSKKMSLKELGDTIGLSHQGIKLLELETPEKMKLEDILKLDIALGLDGELLDFSWKVAELYAGIHRIKTEKEGRLQTYQSFEIHGIEKLIVLSRLFQHYFPENREWLDEYRKQSYKGFSDWIS